MDLKLSYTGLVLIALLGFHSVSSAQGSAARENPEISVNGLFLGALSTEGHNEDSHFTNGLSIQEVEFRFLSNVDPYFRAEFTLAIHPEHSHQHEHEDDDHDHEDKHSSSTEGTLELEEAFVETINLSGLIIRAGKFFAFLGRHNQLHTHNFPFIDAPMPHTEILGDHGLNETGISLSYLLPTTWYSEVVLQGFSGDNEKLFHPSSQGAFAGLVSSKNLWELSDSSDLEFILGYAGGANAFDHTSHLYNAALTYRWRPITQSIYNSFQWTTEILKADREGASLNQQLGLVSWAQYQFARRWWLQGRAEHLKMEEDHLHEQSRYSALLGFIPSEFSSLRLQIDHIPKSHHGPEEQRLSLQWSVSIGSHPAHTY